MQKLSRWFFYLVLCAITPVHLFAETARLDEPVSVKDILPMRVMYESMRSESYSIVLVVSDKEVQLQRFVKNGVHTEPKTVATIPTDAKALETALSNVRKDSFRGHVTYSNPNIRDGGSSRMITPLGDITEYGVFLSKPDSEKWPQSIMALEPLFKLFEKWANALVQIEKKPDTQ